MKGLLTRREWLIAGTCLLLFAALAIRGLVPRLEAKLVQAAVVAVQTLESQSGGARYDRIVTTFDGQQALLSGSVRHQQDGLRLIHDLTHNLRTPGNPFNPVTKVSATSTLQIKPLQSGWIVAAVRGFNADIIGACATIQERDAIEQSLKTRWPTWRGSIKFSILVDPQRFDESSAWLATVRSLPAPEARGRHSAHFYGAQIGKTWKDLPLEKSHAIPKPVQALGVTSNEWHDRLQTHHDAVVSHLNLESTWELEQERLRSLPPAHVFIGKRGNQILLRGEVFDIEAKRAVIAAIMAALPDFRLLDDIRTSGARRPDPGFGSFLPSQALNEIDGKAFAIGLPGKSWAPIDWQVSNTSQPWLPLLPPEIEPRLLAEDSTLVIDWLQGSNAGIPSLPVPPSPAFLTLAVFQDRVMLGGRIAEPALHAQIVAAMKRTYPSGYTILDEIAVSGSTIASESVQNTIQTIPLNKSAVLFAMALPGKPWRILSQTEVISLSSLPSEESLNDIPSQTLANAFAPALDEVQSIGLISSEPSPKTGTQSGKKP